MPSLLLPLVGTKDITFKFTKQLGNGDFLADVTEVTYLPGGEIYTMGSINANALEDLKRQKLDVVGGAGIYEGIKGKEYVTQLDSSVLDVANISFEIH